jgi:hypothetical protein
MFRSLFRKRTNRIGIYKPADEGAINVSDVETAFNKSSSKSSSSSKNKGSNTVPVNWNVGVGLYGLTSIKNRRSLVDIITHDLPAPTKGIFNKVLIDYLLYYRLLDNEKELIKYISGITVIYLKDIELTPQIIKLLRLTTKYSLHIHTIVLINITLTLKIIKIFRVNEYLGIKNLMVSNIKLPNEDNEDNEIIIDELIKMIKKMTNIEVLDFSGFNICDIYKNRPSRAHTTRYKFAKLFNKLILKLVNLKFLNFTNNIMDETEYDMIFQNHTINNIIFEYWDNEYATDTFVRIYYKDGMYRTIYVNAPPNFNDKSITIHINLNVNVNVKYKIEEKFIVAIKGGRKLRKKKPAKPTKKKIITKN